MIAPESFKILANRSSKHIGEVKAVMEVEQERAMSKQRKERIIRDKTSSLEEARVKSQQAKREAAPATFALLDEQARRDEAEPQPSYKQIIQDWRDERE